MTLKDILKAIQALDKELMSLLEKENLSDEEDARISQIEAEQKDLEGKKVHAERKERLEKEIKDRETWNNQLADTPDNLIDGSDNAGMAVVTSLRERVLDDPKSGFARYDDFAMAVKRACVPGDSQVHENLRILCAYGNNSEAGADGGFLIPPEFSNKLLERSQDLLPIIEQCDKLTLSGNSVTINGTIDHDKSSTTYRYGGVVVYWVGEGGQITRSNLKFRQVTLKPHKMAALSYVTDEEMEDVANFGTRLLDKQAVAIGDELVEVVMFGSGVGKPLGAFVGTSPCVQVAKETGQAADTVLAENIYGMEEVLFPPSVGKARWYYNPFCHKQLRTMAVSVGTGGELAKLFDSKSNTLDGMPAYRTDHCEALGDAGDIVLADFSHYLLAMKGTIKTAMSIHLRFDYAETAFRSMFRVDGRPAWETNLRPRKGASTARVSPFVKLAARA